MERLVNKMEKTPNKYFDNSFWKMFAYVVKIGE